MPPLCWAQESFRSPPAAGHSLAAASNRPRARKSLSVSTISFRTSFQSSATGFPIKHSKLSEPRCGAATMYPASATPSGILPIARRCTPLTPSGRICSTRLPSVTTAIAFTSFPQAYSRQRTSRASPRGQNRIFTGTNVSDRIPDLNLSGSTNTHYTVNWMPWNNTADDYQVRDDLSWTKGAHQFKFGFGWAIYKKVQDYFAETQGGFTFDGSATKPAARALVTRSAD